jgi:hypothetical protein
MQAADLQAAVAGALQGAESGGWAALLRPVVNIIIIRVTDHVTGAPAERGGEGEGPGVKQARGIGLDKTITVALVDGDAVEAKRVEIPAGIRDLSRPLVPLRGRQGSPEQQRNHPGHVLLCSL